MHVHVCMCVYVQMRVYLCILECVRLYVRACACMHACTGLSVCACMCMHVQMCMTHSSNACARLTSAIKVSESV